MTCIIFPKKTAERKFYVNVYINADERVRQRDDAHTARTHAQTKFQIYMIVCMKRETALLGVFFESESLEKRYSFVNKYFDDFLNCFSVKKIKLFESSYPIIVTAMEYSLSRSGHLIIAQR